ncbi:PREDICTED: protein SIEVE ELEMENT OCCLUSION B [Theobroma cacao]|uniref:Protein SIEVE ELEMENT OCCLUSION B n=1 Tax=Theobroma cacao TaxID=3641 RepID=A0AB32WCA2_THECC|nr:PREDICTED: protein SIEVE ELEMENT OCCLUSION B [Theobroma cacao]
METPSAFLSSKTSVQLLDEIRATHANDDQRAVDVKPILLSMTKILDDVEGDIKGTARGRRVTSKGSTSLPPAFDHSTLESILADIREVSGEFSCNCSEGENAHATTMKLLETLKTYSWNTKVVLALAAFTANLGESWLLLQRGNTNSLATSVAFLRQVPEIDRLDLLGSEVGKLIQAIRNLASCNAKFMMKVHPWYFSKDTSPISEAKLEIIRAAYWTIHSVVQIASLIGRRNKSTALSMEKGKTLVAHLETEVSEIRKILMYHLKRCKEYIGKEMEDAYQSLLELMQRSGRDIVEILNRFLCHGNTDKVDIEKLRSKHVLFLISDLDISLGEITVLNELYLTGEGYEVVWLPVVDGLYDKKKFVELKSSMKWYTDVPAILDPAVIKYIKEVWHFIKNQIAVFLTPEGKVTCQSALPMLWTWGNEAVPFTDEKVKDLWRKRYHWRLDFLIDDLIDPELRQWIVEGKLICLYGGGSIDWIREFNTGLKFVLARIGESVEMVYVGKNNDKDWTEKVIRDLRVIKSERHFWARLQSMLYLYTKMRQGKTSTKDDPFMQEVMKILSYDGGDRGWALFCKGPDVKVRMDGETARAIISKHGDLETYAKRHGFLEGLNYYMEEQDIPHSCVLQLPFIDSEVPGKMCCDQCGREMEMHYTYRCRAL